MPGKADSASVDMAEHWMRRHDEAVEGLWATRAERDRYRAALERIAGAQKWFGSYGTTEPTWEELRNRAREALSGNSSSTEGE